MKSLDDRHFAIGQSPFCRLLMTVHLGAPAEPGMLAPVLVVLNRAEPHQPTLETATRFARLQMRVRIRPLKTVRIGVAKIMDVFEIVHTVTDWYDGPREGISEFHGHPCLYRSEWRNGEDIDADTFLLMPTDADVFSLALEDWAIWRRWETAFHQGNALQEMHPALPEDRQRHEELQQLLEERLVVDLARAVGVKTEFRVRDDSQWNGYGVRPLDVQWEQVD
jgi:hypothetical protein